MTSARLLVMLPIEATTFRQAYDGVANSTLWFLLHMLFEPGSLGDKDVGLFGQLVDESGAQVGLVSSIRSQYRKAVDLGLGELDLTALIETLRRASRPLDE